MCDWIVPLMISRCKVNDKWDSQFNRTIKIVTPAPGGTHDKHVYMSLQLLNENIPFQLRGDAVARGHVDKKSIINRMHEIIVVHIYMHVRYNNKSVHVKIHAIVSTF